MDDWRVSRSRKNYLRSLLGDDFDAYWQGAERSIRAWGPESPVYLTQKDRDESLALEVQFADGNPERHPDAVGQLQFEYKRGRRRKAVWSAEVLALTRTTTRKGRAAPQTPR